MPRRTMAVALTGLAVAAAPSYAAWVLTGSGAGTAQARTLTVAGHLTTSGTTSSTADLTWGAAPALPTGSITYVVERAPFAATTGWVAACGSSLAAPVVGTSCTDTGLAASTDYQYRVTSVYAKWRRQGTPSGKVSTTAATPVPTSLAFSPCPTAGIGANKTVLTTVQLLDAKGAPTASGPGGVTVTLSSNNTAAGSVSPSTALISAGSSTSEAVTLRSTPGNASNERTFTVTAVAPGLITATCTVQK